MITNCKIADTVKIPHGHLTNLYGCEIDSGTEIGPFVEIQVGVKIGKNCKIQSHSFICEGVTIEDGVFIGHGVCFTNDLYPKAEAKEYVLKRTQVGQGASIGNNATILPVKIGKNALIGAGAVVSKDVPDNMIVCGNPAKPIENGNFPNSNI